MSKRKKDELHVPGNVVATHVAMEAHLARLGATLLVLDHSAYEGTETRPLLERITVKVAPFEGEETMVILKGVRGAEQVVAFHISDSVSDAIVGAIRRFNNNSVSWREDVPFEGQMRLPGV